MKKILIFLISAFLASQSFADFTAVEDIKVIENTYKILETANDQLDKLKELKTVNENIQKELTGKYGFGNLLNSDDEIKNRKVTPNQWEDALKNSDGNKAYQSAFKNYNKIYKANSADKIAPASSSDKNHLIKDHYERSQEINRAALAASEASFNEINQHIQNIHDMIAQLEDASKVPNEKAAVDLNARLVAENAFIQVEMLRQQTIQNQLLAMQSQSAINGMSDQADFLNTKGDQ